MDYGGLSDYPHCQIKLKKYKTSENEQSHGSFFLRVGGLGTELILQFNCFPCPELSPLNFYLNTKHVRPFKLQRESYKLEN